MVDRVNRIILQIQLLHFVPAALWPRRLDSSVIVHYEVCAIFFSTNRMESSLSLRMRAQAIQPSSSIFLCQTFTQQVVWIVIVRDCYCLQMMDLSSSV